MSQYKVTLAMDADSAQYFKGHSYTLYLFKGINAGAGAISTVWRAVSGDQLVEEPTINIEWNDEFDLGKTGASLEHGVPVSDIEPVGRPISRGHSYRRFATGWDSTVSHAPDDEFRVVNAPNTANRFYASQSGDFAVVQEARRNSGVITFEPLPTVSMLVATDSYEIGTLVTEAFTSGAVVTLPAGVSSSHVDYDTSTGWRGPHVSMLRHSQPIHDQMVGNTVRNLR